jgi:hypothetical protein
MSAVDEAIARLAAKEKGELREGRYDDRRTTGFVVRKETRYPAKNGRPATTAVDWWLGESESSLGRGLFWNTFGELNSSVAWFDTKVKAKLAIRRCSVGGHVSIVTVGAAKAERADELDARAAKLIAHARMLRG